MKTEKMWNLLKELFQTWERIDPNNKPDENIIKETMTVLINRDCDSYGEVIALAQSVQRLSNGFVKDITGTLNLIATSANLFNNSSLMNNLVNPNNITFNAPAPPTEILDQDHAVYAENSTTEQENSDNLISEQANMNPDINPEGKSNE
jgi:hypothetical protein